MTTRGNVQVTGVGMTPFGRHPDLTSRQLAGRAVADALADAGISSKQVQAVYAGNSVEGLTSGQESIRGQVALRESGLQGVPIFNIENACSSGSTAFHLGWQAVAGGAQDCVLVVGFEKLVQPDKQRVFRAFDSTMDLSEMRTKYPNPSQDRSVFMDHYAESVLPDDGLETLAEIASKNHFHGSLNSRAQFQHPFSAGEVLASRHVIGPLHLFMCAPLSDGAAAAVLMSESFATRHGGVGVSVLASAMVSGGADHPEMEPAVQRVVRSAYEAASIGPEDLDLVELHDATALGEFELYSAIGLCSPGDEAKLLQSGEVRLGGRLPVNPSGGLIARGHPIGATGVAQIVEVVDQIRHRCDRRQVEGARIGLTQNVGGLMGHDVASATAHVLAG